MISTTSPALLGVDCTHILDRYDAVRRQAREAYAAVESQAREAYAAVESQAWEADAAVRRQAWEAYVAVRRQAWEAYVVVRRQAREAYDAVERPAREAHDAELLELDDPLVTWVVRNAIAAHRDEAVGVLRLLPCTLADLDRHARANGWCSAWTDLRESAVSDLGLVTA